MAVAPATRVPVTEPFGAWVDRELAATRRCIHCGTCTSLCPLASEMVAGPRAVMALARRGEHDMALTDPTIWLCTSCYACSVACPREIPVTDVMYALKRRALADGARPVRREAPVLTEEFGAMVRRSGRITESRLLTRIYMRTGVHRMARFAGVGMSLFRRGRVGLRRERIRRPDELARMLDRVAAREERS